MRRLVLVVLLALASVPVMAQTASAQSCASEYPAFCIPPPPPNLNCPDIGVANFIANQPDRHGLDGNDNDGKACENDSLGPNAITNPNGVGARALAAQTATTVSPTTVATTPATTAVTQAPATTSAPAVQSTQAAMPRTGAAEDQAAMLGFGVILLGILAVWWGRPRVAALLSGPRVIEQERIDRAAKILGWSDPWDEHLRR